MRFAVIGRHETLLKSIDLLVSAGHRLSYVLTVKEASEYQVGVADFQKKDAEEEVPIYVSSCIDQNMLENIRTHDADVAISLKYPTIVRDEAIAGCKHGVFNAHGGDLPRYRGNGCQVSAMIKAESKIGLCVRKMIGGELDSDGVIAKAKLPIGVDTRIAAIAAWIVNSMLQLFQMARGRWSADASYILYRQVEVGAEPLRCYPRSSSDGRIVWAQPVQAVARFIKANGLPSAGAIFDYLGSSFGACGVNWHPGEQYLAVPGQIVRINADTCVDIACCSEGFCRFGEVVDSTGKSKTLGVIIKSVRDRLS